MLTAIKAALAAVPKTALYYLVLALVGLLIGCAARGLLMQARHAAQVVALVGQVAVLQTQIAEAERAVAVASENARKVEQQRAADLQAAQEAHDAELARLRTDAARSTDALVRLRAQLAIAIRALRSGSPASGAASASVSETGATAAELLGACADRYRGLAEEADRSYAAGKLAERAYDSLTAASAASK